MAKLESDIGEADVGPSAPATGRRRILIRDLEIVASIGVFEHEKRYEQRILVSLDLSVEDAYDGVSDRIEHVVDYARVVDGVSRLVQQEHLHLIETLAERIAGHCLEDRRIVGVRVRVEKPDVLPSVRCVGVEIERRRR